MSRVQVRPLNVISLQPQARPTQQFHAPEVREGQGASNTLIGLAQGLAAINPTLNSIAERRFEAYRAGSLARGQADQARLALENQEALKKAVREGHLPEQNNPWYMVGLRQSVASVEADHAETALLDAYSRSELQNSDDPRVIEQFAHEQLAPLTQGRDAYEMQVIAPKLNNAMNRLVSLHVQRRAEERTKEMEAAAGQELSAQLDGYSANATPEEAKNLQARVSLWAAEKGKFLTNTTLNAIVESTAKDSALAAGNSAVFEDTLRAIKTTGGKTLADTAHNKLAAGEIRSEIVRQQLAQSRQDDYLRERYAKQAGDALLSSAIGQVDQLRQSGQTNASLEDVHFGLPDIDHLEATQQINSETADYIRQRMIAHLNQQEARQDRQYTLEQRQQSAEDRQYTLAERSRKAKDQQDADVKEAAGQSLAKQLTDLASKGRISYPDLVRISSSYAGTLGVAGVEAAQKIGFNFNSTERNQQTDPDTLKALNLQWAEGKIETSDVTQAYRQGKLSASDFEDLSRRVQKQQSGETSVKIGSYFTKSSEAVVDRIMQGYRLRGQFASEKDFKDAPDQYTQAVEQSNAAKDTFFKAYSAMVESKAFNEKTPIEQMQQVDQLAEQVAKTFGGTSQQEFLTGKLTPKPGEQAQTPKPKEKPTQQADVEKAAKVDPVLQAVDHPALEFLDKIGMTPATLDKGRGNLDSTVSVWKKLTGDRPDSSDPLNQYLDTLSAPSGLQAVTIGPEGQKKLDQTSVVTQARMAALQERQKLKGELAGEIPTFLQKVETIEERYAQGQEFTTTQEKADLYATAQKIQRYAILTNTAGMDAKEAKELNAFTSVPMFASKEDFDARGVQVAKELGLNDQQALAWGRKQLELIQRIRHRAGQRAGVNVN